VVCESTEHELHAQNAGTVSLEVRVVTNGELRKTDALPIYVADFVLPEISAEAAARDAFRVNWTISADGTRISIVDASPNACDDRIRRARREAREWKVQPDATWVGIIETICRSRGTYTIQKGRLVKAP
jgi:hypothetical protein